MSLTRLGLLGSGFVALIGVAAVTLLGVQAPVGGSPGSHTINYLGEQLSVPEAWQTRDLAADPTTCVRFDVHAAYIGRLGSEPNCPAHLVGATDAIHVEPLAGRAAPPGLRETSINGQQALVNSPQAQQVGHRIVAAFPQGGVLATISFGADPSVAQQVLASFTLTSTSASAVPQASAPSAGSAAAGAVAAGPVIYTGKGFDACTAPSEGDMNTWLASSPYRAVGVYIGGLNRACDQPNLTATWVQGQIAAGWNLIPLYVGRQASCADAGADAGEKITPGQAAAEGTSAGSDAADQASALGMRSGSPVYYDMEAWNPADSACNADVVTFIEAWTRALNARGFRSGMYGSSGRGIADVIAPLYGVAGIPGNIDFADWDGIATTSSADIPATAWPGQRRIKQYDGDVTETWGGVRNNIDHDYSNGFVVGNQVPAVATIAPTTAAVGTQVTITGQGFVAGSTTVRFGGTASGHVSVASANRLTASVPQHSISTVDITVSTSAGTATLSGGFTYVPLNAMAVDRVTRGYWLATLNGNVYNFNAPFFGSMAGKALPAPIVGMAAAPGGGYWLVTSKGNVYNFNAPFFGSMAGKALPAPIVGMAAAPGGGYWLVTGKGNVYPFGAPWYGSKAGSTLPAPVVGMVAAPSVGYWLVTSKGNVYNVSAPFYGSMAGKALPAPVVGMVAAPSGGYWLATSKGNVYQFHAPWYGSAAARSLPAPAMAIASSGAGYLVSTQSGNVFNYNAPFYGSPAGRG